MKASAWILAACAVAAVVLNAGGARADEPRATEAPAGAAKSEPAAPAAPAVQDAPATSAAPADACEVPSYLLTTEARLARVAEAIRTRRRLDILVVGSASSLLAGPDGATTSYPARLEAALRERLSGVTVNVAVVLQAKKTAEEVVPVLEKQAKDRQPTLVVWQTGTYDALKSVDPEDFRAAVESGLAALAAAGTDAVLMNLQYSPRMETMITVAPYLDNLRVGAEEHGVPLFDRFGMMRYWNESGRFDLFNTSHGLALAKQVHDCLGQTLAAFLVDAAQPAPDDEHRIQH
ncbi:MAG: SGNH/GDSL hydrolase family protein [Xanthobacteraceae bacterium]|nr:SGNH/GDSL hydrolase family protein [Xanthobacteraceae bacterium]